MIGHSFLNAGEAGGYLTTQHSTVPVVIYHSLEEIQKKSEIWWMRQILVIALETIFITARLQKDTKGDFEKCKR